MAKPTVDEIIKKVEGYQKSLSEFEKELAEVRGSKSQIFKQTKEEFGVANVEEAKKKLKELSDRMGTLEKAIIDDGVALEETFPSE